MIKRPLIKLLPLVRFRDWTFDDDDAAILLNSLWKYPIFTPGFCLLADPTGPGPCALILTGFSALLILLTLPLSLIFCVKVTEYFSSNFQIQTDLSISWNNFSILQAIIEISKNAALAVQFLRSLRFCIHRDIILSHFPQWDLNPRDPRKLDWASAQLCILYIRELCANFSVLYIYFSPSLHHATNELMLRTQISSNNHVAFHLSSAPWAATKYIPVFQSYQLSEIGT